MARPLRIAVLKPDFGVTGGLESVLDRVETVLTAHGHELTRLTVDMRPSPAEVAGLAIPPEVWNAAPEYFPYLAARDRFDQLDTRRHDLVLSTQPPSFSHRHPRHLALFYHHHRVYYDLEQVYLRAGYAPDPEIHLAAGAAIRALDAPRLDQVSWFLAGSQTVADRLRHFGAIDRASVFHAGHVVGEAAPPPPTDPGTGPVLCVGRHEFPKRTELVVAAAHLVDHPVTIVGTGGREAWARDLDHRFATGAADPETIAATDLWCTTGREAAPVPEHHRPRAHLAGRVSDAELSAAYTAAPCVVAPALDEDYGLTAIEAMAQGRPVIVCRDGGGLTELVQDGRTGLVVDPTPGAIAAAITRLVEDRDLAAELGRNGRERAAELSWAGAEAELLEGVERVMA